MRTVARNEDARLAILNAPFEERGWERAVSAICEATGCHGAHLLGMGGPLVLPLNIVSGLDEKIHRYLGDAHLHGRVNWRVGSSTIPMAIQHELHYAAYRAANDTADYDDAASDLDMQFGCQAIVLGDESMFLGIAMMRGRREGACTAETLGSFAALLRPLQRAVRMQLALDGEAAELMLGDMSALHGATILLDRLGSLVAMSPAAESGFEEDGPLTLAGLSVRVRDRGLDRQFQRALARLLKSDDALSAPLHRMRISSGARSWQLVVMRLPEREHGLGFDPHLAVTLRAL
jgi:hypothetical protein